MRRDQNAVPSWLVPPKLLNLLRLADSAKVGLVVSNGGVGLPVRAQDRDPSGLLGTLVCTAALVESGWFPHDLLEHDDETVRVLIPEIDGDLLD